MSEPADSAFVREMKAAFKRRDAAKSVVQKREIELEVREILRRHLGAGAQIVPRDTPDLFIDQKMAAAGAEHED